MCSDRKDSVIAGGWIEAVDGREFGEAPLATAALQNGDDIDGLGDQRARHGDYGFLNELLETAQRPERRAGVNGGDATGMSGAPGLQQVEGFRAANLADRNAVWPQSKRRADEIGKGDDARR